MKAQKAARKAEQNPWLELLARVGLAGRGIVYGVVGVLAIQIAFGDERSQADREGVLHVIAAEPLGRVLLIVVAAGFGGYAVWRIVLALFDPEARSADEPRILHRLGYLGRGLLYSFFTVQALLAAGGWSGGSSTEKAREGTALLLDVPAGRWAVGAFGAGVAVVGLFNAYRAVSGKFRDDLKEKEMSSTERRWIPTIAFTGLVSRAVVFGLIGVFFLRAAFDFEPRQAAGFDGAFNRVASAEYGPALLTVLAIGMFAFGVFSLAQARYREILGS